MSDVNPRLVSNESKPFTPAPRIRAVAWAFALLWLLLLELLLRVGVPTPIARYYRVPNRSSAGIGVVLDSLKRADGPRVAMVGDSITWGMFARRDQASGAYLERSLQRTFGPDARVGNLGLISAHPNDYVPVIVDLLEEDAVDVVVIQFDARFFSVNHARDFRYPELYDRIESPAARRAVADIAPPPVTWSRPLPTAAQVDRTLSSASMIWRLRHVPVTSVFDMKVGNDVTTELLRQLDDGDRVYSKKKPEKLPIERVKFDYDIPPYTENNVYFRDLSVALDMAKRQGVPVIVYAGPVDEELMNRLDLWDQQTYRRRVASAGSIIEKHGATFVDLTSAIPARYIVDTHHPRYEGYRTIAASLFPYVRDAIETKRAAR